MIKEKKVNFDNEKLKRRIYKGIPDALRGEIWSKLLGLETIKEEQRGKYQVVYIFYVLFCTNYRIVIIYF